MPRRRGRLAGALLAVVSGALLSAQAPAPPHVGSYRQHARPYPHAGSYQAAPIVIIDGSGTAPAATPSPKHRTTPRPANAPQVFETHSTAQ